MISGIQTARYCRYSYTYQPGDQVFVLFKSRICSAKIPKSIGNRSNLGWFMHVHADCVWSLNDFQVRSGIRYTQQMHSWSWCASCVGLFVCLFFGSTYCIHVFCTHTHGLHNIYICNLYSTITKRFFLIGLIICCILLVTFGIFRGIITHMEQTCDFRCQKRGLPHCECPGRARSASRQVRCKPWSKVGEESPLFLFKEMAFCTNRSHLFQSFNPFPTVSNGVWRMKKCAGAGWHWWRWPSPHQRCEKRPVVPVVHSQRHDRQRNNVLK